MPKPNSKPNEKPIYQCKCGELFASSERLDAHVAKQQRNSDEHYDANGLVAWSKIIMGEYDAEA